MKCSTNPAVTAKTLAFDKVPVSSLQAGDFISFDGKTFFIFSKSEAITEGVDLVNLRYQSTVKWASYERLVKPTKKIYVAPLGRHYKG